MTASIRSLSLLLGGILLISSSLDAFQYRKGNEIYVSDDFHEDLALTGGTINFDGSIVGDIFAGARTVTFGGTMDGNLNAGCQKANISGSISRSLRCFSQTLNLNSKIDGDVEAFVADATINDETEIGRDLALYAGSALVGGTVHGNAKIYGGEVNITGKIEGNVDLKGGVIEISPTAVIGGDLNYESKEKARISPDAQITGEVKWKKRTSSTDNDEGLSHVPRPRGIFWSMLFFIGSFLIGVLMILIRREGCKAIISEIKTNAVVDGLIGLGIIFLLPVVIVLIAITMAGIPVAIAGLTIYAFIFLVSKVLVAIALGMLLIGWIRKKNTISLGWSLLVGLVVLALLFKIPILGWLVYLLAWAVGAGALVMVFLRKAKSPPVPNPPQGTWA